MTEDRNVVIEFQNVTALTNNPLHSIVRDQNTSLKKCLKNTHPSVIERMKISTSVPGEK